MSAVRRSALLFVAVVLTLGATCVDRSSPEISRERAVEIARLQAPFPPDTIQADRTFSGARPVWRVTLRGRLAGQPPGLFETAVIEIDRRSGEIVSLTRP